MVLQQERPTVSQDVHRVPPTTRKSLWAPLWAAVAAIAILALVIFALSRSTSTAIVQELMPEYGVDTLADPAVTAELGGPVVPTHFYIGSSADELDPNTGE